MLKMFASESRETVFPYHHFSEMIIPRGGGGNSTYYVTGTCHFAQKIGTHNSVNSGGF